MFVVKRLLLSLQGFVGVLFHVATKALLSTLEDKSCRLVTRFVVGLLLRYSIKITSFSLLPVLSVCHAVPLPIPCEVGLSRKFSGMTSSFDPPIFLELPRNTLDCRLRLENSPLSGGWSFHLYCIELVRLHMQLDL